MVPKILIFGDVANYVGSSLELYHINPSITTEFAVNLEENSVT